MQLQDFRQGIAKPTSDWEKELERGLNSYTKDLKRILNSGILPTDNFSCYIGSVTMPGVPGTEITVAHGLARTPSGYILLGADRACRIYNSTASDSTNVYLKSDVADAVIKILVI